jgi:hypothetical protein
MQTFKISRGEKISVNCTSKIVTWENIINVLSKHKITETKEENGYFVGGEFNNNYRNGDNIINRSLITIDVDKYVGTTDDVLTELQYTLPYKLVAYSTYRNSTNKPRFRIVIPLLQEIPAQDYEPLCRALADEFKEFPFDTCAFKPELAMYMPCTSADYFSEAFTFNKNGDSLDINDFNIEKYRQNIVIDKDSSAVSDEFEDLLNYQPLDVTDEEVNDCLKLYKAEGIEYEDWVNVGRALYHQYEGDTQGYSLWHSWSELDVNRFDEKEMKSKWKSFKKRLKGKKPLTFATVIEKASGLREKEETIHFEKIMDDEDDEHKVVDVATYDALRKRLSKTPIKVLPESKRQLLANQVYEDWGKSVGITRATIKRELMPRKKEVIREDDECPEWADDWVYIETKGKYHNRVLNYGINREAFNQKFSGEIECRDGELSASQLMCVTHRMKTVVDTMYWPNGEEFIYHQGKPMVNTYKNGLVAFDSLEGDEEGQRIVEMFLAHIQMTFNNERERTIMLDWMCHIIQYPGKRMNWALLLQGLQGCGKSYFGDVMQGVLGLDNAKKVSPTAITSNFSAWATGSILNIVEEIYVGGVDKYTLMNKIKGYVRDNQIQIEEKGRDQRNVPNFASYLFFTNYKDALAITNEERCYCIIYGSIQTVEQLYRVLGSPEEAETYFSTLFEESMRRIDAIASYLMNRTISSEFKHKGRAPLTEARSSMIGYSANPEVEHFHDLIDKFRCAIINDDIIDLTYLTSLIKMDFDGDNSLLPSAKMIQHILISMDFQKITNRVYIAKGEHKYKKHNVWIKNIENMATNVLEVQEFHNTCEF